MSYEEEDTCVSYEEEDTGVDKTTMLSLFARTKRRLAILSADRSADSV